MSTLGLFNTSHFNASALPESMAKTVLTKYPYGTAQLFALSAAMNTSDISSVVHTWTTRTMTFPKVTSMGLIPQGVKGTAMQIDVDSTGDILPKDILLVSGSDEQLYVESLVGPTSMIVRRGFGISPPLPIPPGTRMTYIGNAHEEASLRPMMRSWSQTEASNRTQIFRDAYAASGTATAVQYIAALQGHKEGNLIAQSKADAAMFHATAIEHSLLFGEQHVSVANGQPIRKMDGFLSMLRKYAPQNISYAASTTTKKQFDRMVRGAFEITTDPKHGNDRIMYLGNAGMEVMQELITNQGEYQFTENQTSFGLSFNTYKTPSGGILRLMTHPLLNTNPEWARMALIVDPSSMGIRYLRGRRGLHQTFNQNVNKDGGQVDMGIDAEGGAYLSELTMEMVSPEANAVIYGLCQAACEPCVTAPTVYEACFEISHPCDKGPVAPGSTIMLQIKFGKPNGTVNITTPTGVETISLDANGNGMVQYTMPIAPDKYAFIVQGSQDNLNVIFKSVFQLACIATCEVVKVESNSPDTAQCEGVETTHPQMEVNSPTLEMTREIPRR